MIKKGMKIVYLIGEACSKITKKKTTKTGGIDPT